MDAAAPDADAGFPDPVDTGPAPDLGCIEIPDPGFPQAWPYAHTKGAYVAQFLATAPGTPTRCAACHRDGTQAPRVPQAAADLDTSMILDQAIGELWQSLRPVYRAEVDRDVPELLWAHRVNGGAPPAYNAGELSWLEGFVGATNACGWVGDYVRHRDDGPRCEPVAPPDAGPAPDLGSVDAGVGATGGDAAASPDPGPADSGTRCECPLPSRTLDHCEGW